MLEQLRHAIWGFPLLFLLAFTGIYFTWALSGIQFRAFFKALGLLRKDSGEGEISGFQALTTALAGAIGTGSIVGIATAVSIGGFGALFWMWVIAILGMATSYAETLLAVKYREIGSYGEAQGGPMYTLSKGVKSPVLAALFALFALGASFGIGSTIQANSVASALSDSLSINVWVTGLLMMLALALVILGGVKSIGRVTSVLVPFMAIVYIIIGSIVLIANWQAIPAAFMLIVKSAFSGQAATGGFSGAGILIAMEMGVSRGVFSNESGLGSIPIAASAARAESPVRPALICMTGNFFSTLIVCTLTGLVLAVTNVQGMVDGAGVPVVGAALAMRAFSSFSPLLQPLLTLCLIFFAFSTTLAWAYYGERSLIYLVGSKSVKFYRWAYTLSVLAGAGMQIEAVWAYADLMNGLMAFPNLIATLWLAPVVVEETKKGLNSFGSKLPASR